MNKSIPVLPPISLPQSSSGVLSIARCKDYAGNSYIARAILRGNDTWVELFKRDRAGQVTQFPSFEMQNGPSSREGQRPRKISDLTIMLDGGDIVATVTGCDLTDLNRLHYPEEYVWSSIAIPFPNGISEASGAGLKMNRAEEIEVSGPTKEEIAQEVVTRLIPVIKAQCIEAIKGLNLWSQSLQDRGLDAYIKDRVYEVARDNPTLYK